MLMATSLCVATLSSELLEAIDGYTFYIFAGNTLISFLFCICFVKETRGLNATQLKNLYRPEDCQIQDQHEE